MFESLVWAGDADMPDFTDPSYAVMEIGDMGESSISGKRHLRIGYNFMTSLITNFTIQDEKSRDRRRCALAGSVADGTYPYFTTAWLLSSAKASPRTAPRSGSLTGLQARTRRITSPTTQAPCPWTRSPSSSRRRNELIYKQGRHRGSSRDTGLQVIGKPCFVDEGDER